MAEPGTSQFQHPSISDPYGVVINPGGNLVFVDDARHKVIWQYRWALAKNGDYWKQTTLGKTFVDPYGVAVDPRNENGALGLTRKACYAKMSDMALVRVSVRELQQNLKRVIERVEAGQIVEVTLRRRPVAKLSPVRPKRLNSPWPDLDARARSIFGDRIVVPSASVVVVEDRGE